MKLRRPNFAYSQVLGFFCGSLLLVFGSQYVFDVSAKSYDAGKAANGVSNAAPVANGKIAFERAGRIYTINPDGTNWTTLTSSGIDYSPNWSPNGLNIAFFSNRDGNYEIYKMNADGSMVTRLTNNSTADQFPSYSPDGSTIIFVSNRDGNDEIYKMNPDGTNQVRLTNNSVSDTYPAFSPDGQKILYSSGVFNGQNPMNLFTMNADGSNNQAIPGGPTVPSNLYRSPSYSPDASKIIFTYTPDFVGNPPGTWTMNPDGTNRAQYLGYRGTYSPVGNKVAYTNFLTQINQPSRLFVSNLDGSSVQFFAEATFVGQLEGIDWQTIPLTHRAAFDFDADGRSDISVFRSSNSVWHLLRSQAGYTSVQWGLATDVLAPADYDGDLKTDIAVWRPSEGNYYVLNSFNNSVRIENFGLAGDVPTGGDWDGDGRADPAVYRSGSQSYFYFRGSMGNPNGNITYIPWGINGDRPVAADYDGDGRTDPAIYRNGTWWISQSSSGQPAVAGFGLASDTLIPADYDADGKTDIAVFRDGIWYLLRSAQGFGAFQFGIAGDIPAPADYDGDGRADAAIYRNGVWWILNSQSGTPSALQFGLSSDAPVPSAFVR